MLKQYSEDFKIDFLMQFTKQLIINSTPIEIYKLKHLVKDEEIDKKHHILKKRKEIEKQTKNILKNPLHNISNISLQKTTPIKRKRILRIPSARLPPHLQYLKPSASNVPPMNLGKLNPLLKNPLVTDIQCNGVDENIIANGSKGEKKTSIILTKEDIDEILQKFSTATKIPLHDGLYKVAHGKLILNAIISKVTGSRFTIKKMNYNPEKSHF